MTEEEFKVAGADEKGTERLKSHLTEHVSNYNAPPVVEFTNVCMEFHP